ncbi:MAG: DUF6364 family protein [Treponema sp.]|nr:DUF6364 family protein [Treponema sp.]
MNQKLTLSLDADMVDFAHSYSKHSGRPVSQIVESYFRELKARANPNIPREVAELRGILKGAHIPDKKELKRLFHEDHIG